MKAQSVSITIQLPARFAELVQLAADAEDRMTVPEYIVYELLGGLELAVDENRGIALRAGIAWVGAGNNAREILEALAAGKKPPKSKSGPPARKPSTIPFRVVSA